MTELVEMAHTGATYENGAHAMPTSQPSAWFTVFTADGIPAVERYLYSHTTIALSTTVEQYGKTYTAALCETVADTQERADYLAQYQADRLASGLHGTGPVVHTTDEALALLEQRSGVRL